MSVVTLRACDVCGSDSNVRVSHDYMMRLYRDGKYCGITNTIQLCGVCRDQKIPLALSTLKMTLKEPRAWRAPKDETVFQRANGKVKV